MPVSQRSKGEHLYLQYCIIGSLLGYDMTGGELLNRGIQVVSPRKVSRFAPLNRYYIIIDEVFFANFLVIIYLLVACKKNNNSFIFNGLL